MFQPYLSSFPDEVILYSNIFTFDFMVIYVKGYHQIMGKKHFGPFSHKTRWIQELIRLLMVKFSQKIHFGVIQNRTAAIFEILIFCDFSGGQSPNFSENDVNLNFDPLKNCEKSKFQKSPQNDFVSSQNVSLDQISASTDFWASRSIAIYVKIDHFFYKVHFPHI